MKFLRFESARIPVRLLAGSVVLFFIFGIGMLQGQWGIGAATFAPPSVEVGIADMSPSGASGGLIIPASCEIPFEHNPGECYVYAGAPASMTCNPNGTAAVTFDSTNTTITPGLLADTPYAYANNCANYQYFITGPTNSNVDVKIDGSVFVPGPSEQNLVSCGGTIVLNFPPNQPHSYRVEGAYFSNPAYLNPPRYIDQGSFTTPNCAPPPQCSDGIDNDGDGQTDFPNDTGCSSPSDNDETNPPQCSDGIDNDGDGKIDMVDPSCSSPGDNDETNPPQCSDGIDNDGDGNIDFPNDTGCSSPSDNDETNPPPGQCTTPTPVDPPAPICAPPGGTGSITWQWYPIAGANQYEIDILNSSGTIVVDNGWQNDTIFNCASGTCRYTTSHVPGSYRSRVRAQGLCTPSLFGTSNLSTIEPCATSTVTVSINSGSGTITGPGISCPGDCSETYPDGTWIGLIATPSSGYSFTSWAFGAGSVCGGQGSTCSALIDGNKTASVNFSAAPSFNYTLANSGTSNVTKTSGDAFTQNTITKTLTSGGTQSVTLSVSGQPAGVTSSISNQGCSPTCTSVITFTVPASTLVGTYSITVTGSPLNKQTSFNLVISGNPMTASCSASPSPAFLGQTVTWTASVSGGLPPFTYSWSGTNIPVSPAPDTNPFSIVYNTIGQKTATVTVTDTDSVQANCPTGVVKINFDPLFEEF